MPKIVSDYSNTIIYKITCKDPNIQDVYVGHTVNFIQRKQSHRLTCINTKSSGYNCKVYRVIRNNGGWDNWKMEIVGFYDCKDLYEARQKEQEHFVALNANLNSVEPFPYRQQKPITPTQEPTPHNPIQTLEMPKHIMNHKHTYTCEPCIYHTTCNRDYERHLLTQKHIDGGGLIKQIIKSSNGYSCSSCYNTFKSRTSIYKHISRCKTSSLHSDSCNTTTTSIATPAPTGDTEQLLHKVMTNNQELTSAIMILIQQNTELQSKIMEYCISRSNYG